MFQARRLATLAAFVLAIQGGSVRLGAEAAAGTPPRTIQDITRLLEGIAPDPARVDALRARMNQPVPEGLDPAARASAFWDRARAAQEAGAVQRQIADLRSARELGSAGDPDRVQSELAVAEYQGGNPIDALRGLQALSRPGGRPGIETAHMAILARVMLALGDLASAHQVLDAARIRLAGLERLKRAAVMMPNWRNSVTFALGEILDAEGRHGEAEKALRAALGDSVSAISSEGTARSLGYDYPSTETLVNRENSIQLALAVNLMRQGRLDESELAVREALGRTLARNGRDSMNTGVVVTTFSRLLYEGGRFQEAETLARMAVAIFEKAGLVPESLALARARWVRAEALVCLTRDAEACAEYEKVRTGLGAAAEAPLMLRSEAPWAIALIRTGQPEQALRILQPLLQAGRSGPGDAQEQTAEWRGFQALALARLGRREEALSAFAEASRAFMAPDHPGGSEEGGTPGQIQRRAWILEGYVDLLCGLHEAGQDTAGSLDVPAEALRVADAARGGRVQRAVAASATRAAVKDPRMADQVRRQQDLGTQVAALYRLLGEVTSAPPDQQSAEAIQALKRTVAGLSAERDRLDAALRRAFPRFRSLVEPNPATLAAARAALAEDEALLSILVTRDQSFVWALRKRGPVTFCRAPLGERELGPMVALLRKAVDPGQIRTGTLPGFDLDTAYRLYRELLAPAGPGWTGAKTLVACVNGSLGQLPLAVLPTGPWPAPSGDALPFASYRDVPWLARTCALFQVPSVEALVRLRGLGPGRRGRRAFLGFGDPLFSRDPALAPVAGTGLRNLAIIPTAPAGPAGAGPRPEPDGWAEYDRIPPLPETREEVLAIAGVLAADPARDVFLGAAASKKTLLALPLDQWQTIAFATHGLVPGDFPGLREPALALAAPETPGESGLLTLDEILGLKLDADWVILSACNTAAGDGLGAEAVSGLGRAFFYAGSRALLVTHWPVESISARELVTSLFRHRGAAPGQSRAESLRLAMLDVMARDCLDPASGKPVFAYAHPLFWAPYSLVGDGDGSAGP